jgi:acylphosphatase
VTGRVQGVGYRAYVERVAEKLGFDGWVRNRRDGSVEVYAIGAPEKLGQMRAALKNGPMMARVDRVAELPDVVQPKYSGQFVVEITE